MNRDAKGRLPGTFVEVTTLPSCDFCPADAAYDAKTKFGPWANLCVGHWIAHRAYAQLGTGMGQRLELQS